jgi:hypothetical protein
MTLQERVGHGLRSLAGGDQIQGFVRGKPVLVERAAQQSSRVAGRQRGGEDGVEIGARTQ